MKIELLFFFFFVIMIIGQINLNGNKKSKEKVIEIESINRQKMLEMMMKKMTKKTKSTRIRFCNMTLAWSPGPWRDKAD